MSLRWDSTGPRVRHALAPSPHTLVFQEPWGLFLCHVHSYTLMSVPTARLLSFAWTILKLPNWCHRYRPPPEHLTVPFPPVRTLQWLPTIFRIRLEPLKGLTSTASNSTLPCHWYPLFYSGHTGQPPVLFPCLHSTPLCSSVSLNCRSSVTMCSNPTISDYSC